MFGVITGRAAILYVVEPPPAPEPVTRIVEVPVEVEKIVEVPVEVVKIVEIEVPAKPKPRPAKPRPAKPAAARIAKAAPPPASPEPAPRKREPGPIPAAATVLDRAFARSQPGEHTRLVEILRHGAGGTQLAQTLELARTQYRSRTLTLGVVRAGANDDEAAAENRFLSIETGKLEDDRFGFRPASGEVEPLKGGSGSDLFDEDSFFYDDFRIRSSGQFVIYGIERSRVEDAYYYVVAVKPRYRAQYERVEFVIDAEDYTLVEAHYFRAAGLRPYRIVQYPRGSMKAIGKALVPMRIIARNFEESRVDEARVVKLSVDKPLDRKLFTLKRMQDESLEIPNL